MIAARGLDPVSLLYIIVIIVKSIYRTLLKTSVIECIAEIKTEKD